MKRKSNLLKEVTTCLCASLLMLTLTGCGSDDAIAEDVAPETVVEEVEPQEVVEDTNLDDVNEADTSDSPVDDTVQSDGASVHNGPQLIFSTVDFNGNAVSTDTYKDAKVIMLNFWEPWCGPCAGEMPDLEQLYQKYKDQGFVILGVFSTEGEDESVTEVLNYTGVTYPILRAESSMQPFMTEYVPTTIFMDGNGNVISGEPYVGSNSYDNWDQIIQSMMEQ